MGFPNKPIFLSPHCFNATKIGAKEVPSVDNRVDPLQVHVIV